MTAYLVGAGFQVRTTRGLRAAAHQPAHQPGCAGLDERMRQCRKLTHGWRVAGPLFCAGDSLGFYHPDPCGSVKKDLRNDS